MRLDAVQVKVPIGCVFMLIIAESETFHIYKEVLHTINTVAQTQSRVSELVATKHIINKVILDVGLLLFRGHAPV
jgi:hypothetical protein